MLAIGIINIPIFARLMRGSILGQRQADYVLAARSIGVRNWRILRSEVLPNAISPVIVAGTLALATAIIDAAGLGFLGLGSQDPSTPEWGTMLDGNRPLPPDRAVPRDLSGDRDRLRRDGLQPRRGRPPRGPRPEVAWPCLSPCSPSTI